MIELTKDENKALLAEVNNPRACHVPVPCHYLPGANYNFNNSTNAYEVFNSKQALKKIENLLDGNKTRLVIINNIP